MTLKSFFQIPLVKFGVHVILLVGFFLNAFYFYRVWEMQKKIDTEKRTLAIVRQENSDSRNQKDYYTSDLYKEKFAKEENFKKKGEMVVDTSSVELATGGQGNTNYIPDTNKEEKSNVEKWFTYLQGR
jgi:hypothetical protein